MEQETFKLISKFWNEFEKIKKTISHVGGFDGFCQCESEKVIEKMSNPTEARSFLIIGMLIDQSIGGFNSQTNKEFYQNFRFIYTYPKLVAHFDGSECSSAWFCYPNHGYDRKVNWSNMESISKVIFPETKRWFLENYDSAIHENVRFSVLKNINSNFRQKPERQKLIHFVDKFF